MKKLKKKEQLIILLLVLSLAIFSGCAGKSTPVEISPLLTEKESFRVTPETETGYTELIKLTGFSTDNSTGQPDKIILSAIGGAPVFQTLDKKELGPGEKLTITVMEQSGVVTKIVTINEIKQITEKGSSTVAANVTIKTIQ